MSFEKDNRVDDFSIGNFRVYPSKNMLIEKDNQIHVTPKVLAVLILLAERKGETVSKDEIINSVWGNVSISDMVLSKAISDLRKALGDSAQNQNYITTVSKKGYALIAEVNWINSNGSDLGSNSSQNRLSKIQFYIITLAVLITLSVIAWLALQKKSTNLINFREAPVITNITLDNQMQRFPRFSSNGKMIAYFEKSISNEDRLILSTLASNNKKVLKLYRHNSKIGWSKGISFSGDDKYIAVRTNLKQFCEISIIEIETGIEKDLKTCPFSTISSVDFSPDNKKIVTTSFDQGKRIVSLVEIDIKTGEVELAGSELEEFGGFLFPRYNIDGSKIASVKFIAGTASWSIAITDTRTGTHETVYQSDRQINQVVWGSGNNDIFFVTHQGTSPGIWHLNLDTGKKTKILNTVYEIADLDYSKQTGDFIYSVTRYSYSIAQKEKQANGKYRAIDLSLTTKNNISPSLSPNEKQLAYISRDSGPDRLVLHGLDGSEDRILFTTKRGRLLDASWSPDSTRIMTTRVIDDTSSIITIDIVNNSIEELEQSMNVSRGQWSPDGETIYWLSTIGNDWYLNGRKDSDGETSRHELGEIFDFDIGLENRVFVRSPSFAKNPGLVEIKGLFEPNGLVERTSLFEDKSIGVWTVGENNIYFVLWERRKSEIYSLDIESREVKLIDTISEETFSVRAQLTVSKNAEKYFIVLANREGMDLFHMKSSR